MNVILEQREDILANNNTAQNQFILFLNKSHKSSNILNIEEILYGNLDLSILSNNGFNKVKKIIFNKGKITNLTNIPNYIEEIHIGNNILIELEKLPTNLKILNIENNFLSKIDYTDVNALEILNISHNNFDMLDNLPSTLIEIYCNNNKITYINLFELNQLKIINAENNKLTIIDNLPNNIVNLLLDNNPNIQYKNSEAIPNTENVEKNNSNFYDCLNIYFEKKQRYEKDLLKKKRKLYQNAPSKKAGTRIASEAKAKCIYCERNVGTIFSTKSRHHKAICGDAINPCELKIDIFCGDYFNLIEIMDEFYSILQDLREDIINLKLDSLFDYLDKKDTIDIFEKRTKQYSDEESVYENLLEKYEQLFIFEKNIEKYNIYNENLKYIKEQSEEMMKLYNEYKSDTKKINLLKEAVDIHVNEVIPTIKNNNFLKFEKIYVEDSTLYKTQISYSNLEYNFSEEPKVISFKINPTNDKSLEKYKEKKEILKEEKTKEPSSVESDGSGFFSIFQNM
jgi:hypothetical protein